MGGSGKASGARRLQFARGVSYPKEPKWLLCIILSSLVRALLPKVLRDMAIELREGGKRDNCGNHYASRRRGS